MTGSSPLLDSDLLSNIHAAFVEDAAKSNIRLESAQARRLIASLMAKRFVVLSGLAGSGKTKLAQAFGRWITPRQMALDPFFPGAIIASERIAYYVKRSDELAVEFWNSEREEDATKVTLPREMIAEWANYICENGISQETPARQIREVVKDRSKFSDQLHSFETQLKAAAFSLLNIKKAIAPIKCCELIPVGADWTSNENILGYPNGLDAANYVTRPALEFIRQAIAHTSTPHFLILDEMNLSHVERYFADILSAIESGEEIPLYKAERDANGDTVLRNGVPERLKLPDNLFIIGTVNVDETTYMFSPKVLDRANVIEFRMNPADLETFLHEPRASDLDRLDGQGAQFGETFVAAAANKKLGVPVPVKSEYGNEMLLFFNLLCQHNAEFGYRVGYEAARFLHFYHLLGGCPDDNDWFNEAMDAVIVQKFLPKLHGSRSKLEGLLWALAWVCGADRGTIPSDLSAEPSEKKVGEFQEAFLRECLAA